MAAQIISIKKADDVVSLFSDGTMWEKPTYMRGRYDH
jgi:hypothetical protein